MAERYNIEIDYINHRKSEHHIMLLFAALVSCYNFGKNVLEITANNFPKEIEKRSNTTVYFVMFHGERCPACRMAYPEFAKAANQAHGMVKFGHIDTSKEYALASRYQIRGIPTFIIFHSQGETPCMTERTARSFLNAASKYIPNLAKLVDETWKDKKKAVILFSDKPSSPPLWNAVSCQFNSTDIEVGFCNNQDVAKQFDITAFPTILMIEGEKKMVYEGQDKFDLINESIYNFFEGLIVPTPKPTATAPVKLIHELLDMNQLDSECKGKGVFCVVVAGEKPGDELEAIARKYRHDHFRFYMCGEKCPVKYAKEGIWILHHRRNAAIKVSDESSLSSVLDRVADGGAKFESMSTLTNQSEL